MSPSIGTYRILPPPRHLVVGRVKDSSQHFRCVKVMGSQSCASVPVQMDEIWTVAFALVLPPAERLRQLPQRSEGLDPP
jgi:hypothetical protein